MLRPRLLPFIVIATLSAAVEFGSPGARAAPDNPQAARAEIKQVRERIERVQQRLAGERERHDRASARLAEAERRMGEIAGDIDELDTRIHETGARLEQLESRREALSDELAAHQQTLAAQLRAAYRMGRRPGLRLMLGQDDPAAAARALGYYAYMNEARVEAMERAQRLSDDLETVARETREAENSLREDRAALAAKRDELEGMRSERAKLVTRLERSIANDDERLDELRRRRRRLDDVLEELDRVLDDTDSAAMGDRPFASRSGELPWPADGGLRTRFGADRAGGRMQWQGLIIGADAGEKVRAVHHGRVVFADWLSGFGQLIILDHQDGHLTLYGFNERLLREHGEWVSPGEPIATVGESGGRDRPGLYFEIRRGGQPVDPLPWLTAR